MNLVVAFCVLISAGGATISSIRLGQKDIKGATDVLGNTLMLCLTNAVLFGGLAYLFLTRYCFSSVPVPVHFPMPVILCK